VASWTLIPCLGDEGLRGEFNTLSPGRDKRSDGSVGDTAHAGTSSDHNPDETGNTPYEDSDSKNEVHAIDVDASGPWPSPATFDLIVDDIRKRCKNGTERRLHNIIWNRQIASESNGWVWKPYSGTSAHTEHAHFSACYETDRENDTSSWGLVEKWGDMALSSDDKKWIAAEIAKWVGDVVQRYDEQANEIHDSDNDNMAVSSALQYLARDLILMDDKLDEITTRLDEMTPPPEPAKASAPAKRSAAGK
jgi:hypothetical protein